MVLLSAYAIEDFNDCCIYQIHNRDLREPFFIEFPERMPETL